MDISQDGRGRIGPPGLSIDIYIITAIAAVALTVATIAVPSIWRSPFAPILAFIGAGILVSTVGCLAEFLLWLTEKKE